MARAALKPVEEPGTEPDTVPVTAERTPARAKLAEAIEQRDTLARYIAEESAAVSAAETRKAGDIEHVLQAEQELARSMPNFRPDHPPQGATSEELDEFYAWVNSPPTPIAEARAALASAKDEYDSREIAAGLPHAATDGTAATAELGQFEGRRCGQGGCGVRPEHWCADGTGPSHRLRVPRHLLSREQDSRPRRPSSRTQRLGQPSSAS